MATITEFSVVDESELPILADPFGNSVAFRCLGCGSPVLAILLPNQRGSAEDNPSMCPACGSRYWLEVLDESEQLVVHRLTQQQDGDVTLHDEIRAILLGHGSEMSTLQIAREVNKRARYHKRDGSEITTLQVHGRTRNYPKLFTREKNMVGLVEWSTVNR
jgi:DNA-directed RNA polymerase subunit RPC12/RpoP